MKKKLGRPKLPDKERKVMCGFRVKQSIKNKLIRRYGGIQKAIEALLRKGNIV